MSYRLDMVVGQFDSILIEDLVAAPPTTTQVYLSLVLKLSVLVNLKYDWRPAVLLRRRRDTDCVFVGSARCGSR